MTKKSGIAVALSAAVVIVAVVFFLLSGGRLSGPADTPPASGWMQNFTPTSVAKPVPQVAFFGPKGDRHSLTEFRGKVVLVNFWATWCAPCVREMPSLQRLQQVLGGGGFTVLALSNDLGGWSVIKPFLTRIGIDKLPIYHDKELIAGRSLQVRGLPTTLLFDHEGVEQGRLEGIAEWDSPEAVALIRHYMAKKQPR